MIQKNDLVFCKNIHRTYGKNYFFATRFFPKDLRQATYVLYAFFRIPDEIVDSSHGAPIEEVREKLTGWEEAWVDAYEGQESNDPVIRASVSVFKKYNIPLQYARDFLHAMKQDLWKDRYATYEELEEYMYGSAGVVGLIMTHVIGFHDERALPYAKDLGYAMQLTNFLRDIDEDYRDRGRIYLPIEDLEHFSYSEDDIQQQNFSPHASRLMAFEIARARALYRKAEKGIPHLYKRGRLAVRLALSIYEAILDKLEAQEMNPFIGRATTSFLEKVRITLHVLWK